HSCPGVRRAARQTAATAGRRPAGSRADRPAVASPHCRPASPDCWPAPAACQWRTAGSAPVQVWVSQRAYGRSPCMTIARGGRCCYTALALGMDDLGEAEVATNAASGARAAALTGLARSAQIPLLSPPCGCCTAKVWRWARCGAGVDWLLSIKSGLLV